MTNEEASFILANIDRRVCDDDLNEALDMAIKALEQQPCDAISREYILSKAHCCCGELCDDAYCVDADDIKEAPSVQPKAKVGHWIETDEWRETVDGFEQWGYFHKCSECGYVFKFLEIDNYCPNCGAKMESEGEE